MLRAFLIPILFFFLGTTEPGEQDPLQVNQAIIDFLEERVDRNTSEMVRLEMLVSAVFRNDALGFTYIPETKTAIETFTDRTGNCLSFTSLFVAMARALDLDARFREVNVAPTWSKHGHLVVFNRHVNVAVYVEGRPYLVDLFPRIDRIEVGGRVVSDARGYAHYYNNVGADWFAKGSPIMAREFFEKAISIDETAPFVWANLGVAQAHLGQLNEAETAYRKALALDEDNLVAMSNLSELLKKLNRDGEALVFEEKVLDFKMKNPYYHYSLGEQAYAAGDYRTSLVHYQDAIKRNSNEAHFYHALAKAYSQLGDYDQAIESLRKAADHAANDSGRSRYNQKLQALNSLLASRDL
jgi:tetratricopeptide (TPR) repeat protein